MFYVNSLLFIITARQTAVIHKQLCELPDTKTAAHNNQTQIVLNTSHTNIGELVRHRQPCRALSATNYVVQDFRTNIAVHHRPTVLHATSWAAYNCRALASQHTSSDVNIIIAKKKIVRCTSL